MQLILLWSLGAAIQLTPAPPSFIQAQKAYAAQAQAPFGVQLVAIGQVFLGVPYVAGTLDREDQERLVVNLEGQDCFTFVEYCLALGNGFRQQGDYARFMQILERIRYRQGVLDGYASRLHYTSDWSLDNGLKGYLHDVTEEVGGVPYPKKIVFMSQHRSAYRQLKDDGNFGAIVQVEQALARHSFHYIPEESLAALESKIQEGDILALTTSVADLDVVHVGFATFRQGRLHLLHASSLHMQVEIMEECLVDYLKASTKRNGVMVFRPL